jgi:thioredoxin-related protein
MNQKLFIFSAVMLVSVSSFIGLPTNTLPIKIGDTLPMGDHVMQNPEGKKVTLLSQKKENGLLVMFSCNTCPYVIRNQSRTKDICKEAQKKNIGVILLNSNEAFREDDDSPPAMKQYAQAQGYQWEYVIDKNNILADKFGANRTPECFLFNKDLKLVYHGAIDDNPSQASNVQRTHLKIAMDQMLAGKDVAIKETRSVGCSIKRK